ncbi:MAG: 5'/3'-nucleotidase SurE [Phycisphaerae bacterium]|nr:5'/3'-nucleotidase SurE [Phycisphaerae bacterium]MDD5381291.1 5'/3'-nucleotidase SurE [Phycisphaerae bacterium]
MHILLTNDDGIFAPGLAAIYKELVKIGDVTVVAPADSRSGTSHSVTFYGPLVCNKVDINGQFTGFSVQGSPADCVKIACLQLCKQPIDLVISGINSGANAGINIYYSGTVAAAMEAAFLKVPAVATSLVVDDKMDYEKGAEYCVEIIKKLLPIKNGHVVNINIPQLSKGKPKGVKVVPQSTGGFHEHYVPQQNEQGQTVYQLEAGQHRHEDDSTDSTALADGYITITALSLGMTNHEETAQLAQKKWKDIVA